jgi:hypothetical protein
VADSDFDDGASTKHGLDQLKIVYEHKVHYVTFEFTLTPAVVKRIPAGCDYDTAGLIYGCHADARYGNSVYTSRIEWDISTHAIHVMVTPRLLTAIHSPHRLLNSGRRCTSTDPRWLEGIHKRFST